MAERFELVEILGVGGFATAYRARVLEDDLIREIGTEEVALKVPLDSRKRKDLKGELGLMASMNMQLKGLAGANLVRYLTFEVFRGDFVIVMEYVPDGSLRRRIGEIGRQRRMPLNQALLICEGVLRGLSFIHQVHVFHRDIKPENILMKGDTPHIADFGISRRLDSGEKVPTAMGTLFYMAPEAFGPEGASFAADIWSVGVTLYELVTGTMPFGNRDTPVGAIIKLIERGETIPACEVCPDIPQALSAIIGRALSKDISKRYRSADEMCKAIRRFRETGGEDPLEKAIAEVRSFMNDIDRAGEVEHKLKELVKKYPDDPGAYQQLGEFYNRRLLSAEAIRAFCRGIECDPENAMLHWDLALAYQSAGKLRDAAQCLERALSLDLEPGLQRYARLLLERYCSADDMARVITQLREKGEEDPIDKEIAEIRAIMDVIDRAPEVEQKLKNLVEKYPEDGRVYQCMGEFYNRRLLHREAIHAFEMGLKCDPENPMLHWGLALAYHSSGKRRAAVQSLKKVLSLNLDPSLQRYAQLLLTQLRKDSKSGRDSSGTATL